MNTSYINSCARSVTNWGSHFTNSVRYSKCKLPYIPLNVWKAKTSTSLVADTHAPQTAAALLEDMIRPNDVQSLTRFLSKVSCPESHRTQKGAGAIISFYVFVCMWVCSQAMNCGGQRCWIPWV